MPLDPKAVERLHTAMKEIRAQAVMGIYPQGSTKPLREAVMAVLGKKEVEPVLVKIVDLLTMLGTETEPRQGDVLGKCDRILAALEEHLPNNLNG
jgi:hypothetical protein